MEDSIKVRITPTDVETLFKSRLEYDSVVRSRKVYLISQK